MSFFRHVGTAKGNKKVIIIQRELPGEDHMASVIFSDIIPSRFHDDLMKELESDAGQTANEFKEVLERRFFSNGENMLQALHAEGYIKKVASNNIVVRPNSKSSVPLDELNKLLREMKAGGVAIKTLAEMDAQADAESAVAAEPVAAAPAVDQTALMMQMMQTMQALQAEVAALKGGTDSKKGPGRPRKESA